MDTGRKLLDFELALKRLDGDADFFRVLMEIFLQDAPAQMRKLATAVSAGETLKAKTLAHTLKSSSRTLGAMGLGAAFAELESCLGEIDPDAAGKRKLPQLQKDFQAVAAKLREALLAQQA